MLWQVNAVVSKQKKKMRRKNENDYNGLGYSAGAKRLLMVQ